MSAVEDRLAELGITLPPVAAPVAAYVPALVDGDHVYCSGQLPFRDGALPVTGKVGVEVDPAVAAEMAAICAVNSLAAIKSVLGDLDRVEQVVKVTGFVASDPSFTGQPQVVNGASELLGHAFGEAGAHARSAVGVAVLPSDTPVEVEVMVRFR